MRVHGDVPGDALLVEGQLGGWNESSSGFGLLKPCGCLAMLSQCFTTDFFHSLAGPATYTQV